MSSEYNVARWRWEFMRRNPEYIKDYHRFIEIQEQQDADETRKAICKKWSFGFGIMYDPNTSFEKVVCSNSKSHQSDSLAWCRELLNKWLFQKDLEHKAVQIVRSIFLPDGRCGLCLNKISADDLFVKINLGEINSIENLKKCVCDLIDEHFYRGRAIQSLETLPANDFGTEGPTVYVNFVPEERKPRKGQKYKVDYDSVLKVGDWKEKDGLTNQEIARKLFPESFKDSDDEAANPESAIRMVSHYYKRYKELVNGGYKKISVT